VGSEGEEERKTPYEALSHRDKSKPVRRYHSWLSREDGLRSQCEPFLTLKEVTGITKGLLDPGRREIKHERRGYSRGRTTFSHTPIDQGESDSQRPRKSGVGTARKNGKIIKYSCPFVTRGDSACMGKPGSLPLLLTGGWRAKVKNKRQRDSGHASQTISCEGMEIAFSKPKGKLK